MKIVRCNKCGKYIHNEHKCYLCGNQEEFEMTPDISVHKNAVEDYSRMDDLLRMKKYDEVIALSYKVLEWTPNLAGAFWLRLLAKNNCTDTIELISKGFSCDDDSDFCNALLYSTGAERETYENIQQIIREIQKALRGEVQKHELQCKMQTDILQIKKGMQGEIEKRKQKLLALWSELEKTEHALYMIETDCKLLVKEYQIGLETAARTAANIKSQTYKLEECEADKLHSFQIQLGDVLLQSESSKESLESMKKQHPWVKNFGELIQQRDQYLQNIKAEISSLASYESSVQQTISEINRIEQQHKCALLENEKFKFVESVAIIGIEKFNQLLRSVGVVTDASIDLSGTREIKTIPGVHVDDDSETDGDLDYMRYLTMYGIED